VNGKVVLSRFFRKNQTLRFGGEYFYSNDKYNYNDSLTALTDNFSALFAEQDIFVTKSIAAKVGIRFENSTLLNRSALAPRVSMAYRFKNLGQINIAYGVFYQKPDNRYLLLKQNMEFVQATHYIINYTRKANNRALRIEAYYKKYNNLLKTIPGLTNEGDGYARGIEFFYRDKKTIRNLDYWIAYTYLDTKRNYLDYPISLRPNFSTPHTTSLVAKRFFADISLSVNAAYTFATGRPYYNFQTASDGESIIHDNGTTKTYHGLNLSISYLTSFLTRAKNKDFTIIALGINNIIGNEQVFGYNYNFNGTHKTPVTLPAPRAFFIGLFMSFGINRTDDFINENLE
jgi:outer membrane receptor for ferrienterochelin and colicin